MSTEHEPVVIVGGTDGHRGPFTTEPGPALINTETFADLTSALITHQLNEGETGPFVVGGDTRPSGPILTQAVISGALRHGMNVIDLGRKAPTPAIQWVARQVGALAAVSVTASHNGAEDNGWKGLIGYNKPTSNQVEDISRLYWDKGRVVPYDTDGSVQMRPELLDMYADAVVESIETEFGEQPLAGKRFVVDGANGAALDITPTIFERLGAHVDRFSCDESGIINDGCGAEHLGGVEQFLLDNPEIANHPDFVGAIANDGDADRLMGIGMVDGKPKKITGNHSMWALATHPNQPGIVGTLYTNGGLKSRLDAEGIGFQEVPNGDKYVTAALLKKQGEGKLWTRGGEFTGHLIDTNWLTSGDGIRTGAWLAAWAVSKKMTLGDLYQDLPLWPEVMAKIKSEYSGDGDALLSSNAEILEARRIADEAIDGGRYVLRTSGTEKGVFRVWGESPDPDPANINSVIGALAKVIGEQANKR